MSTSGNTSWQLQRDSLINSAYRKLGSLSEGQTLSTEALNNGVEALNAVIALLETEGMPLWKRTSTIYVPSATSQVYTVPAALKVVQVVLLDISGTQYDLIEKSLYDFNRLPSDTIGTPVHYTYQPGIEDGTISIWPPTSDTGTIAVKTIEVIYQKEFDGFFNSTDTPDFPPYWTMAIIYFLALALAPEVGVPLNDRGMLAKEAASYKEMANGYGDEDGSLLVQPDFMNLRTPK